MDNLELNLNENIEMSENEEQKMEKKPKKFTLQGKHFFLTYPKCTLEKTEVRDLLADKVDCEYMIIAQELHKDGTPHIHVLLGSNKKIRTKLPTYFDLGDFHGNYQTARDSDKVYGYVTKADIDPLYYGKYTGNKQSAVQKRAIQNKLMLSKTVPELVDEGLIPISQYKQYKEAIAMYKMDKVDVPDDIPKECIWIYGKPGSGKSRYIRDNFPKGTYFKAQNKWWDGFNGQSVVLIDDFDMGGACIGHYLKIWADRYSFVAEVKGGTIMPVYEKFFITSNYLPRDIWCAGEPCKWDSQMTAAIERRFKVVEVVDGELIEYIN